MTGTNEHNTRITSRWTWSVKYGLILACLFTALFFFAMHPAKAFASYASEVAADGAVSHWNFEESGDTLVDQIGNNDGIIVGAPTQQQPGPVGNGYLFYSSSNNYILLPNDAFDVHTEGAVEAIVKMNRVAEVNLVLLTRSGASNAVMAFSIENEKVMITNADKNGVIYRISGSTLLEDLQFYHIVWQMDALSGASLYVNGVPETLTYQTGDASMRQWWHDRTEDTSAYVVGSLLLSTNYAKSFKGVIDELSVYSAPLHQAAWHRHASAAFGNVITIASPKAYQVFQRNGSGRADIAISGTYLGFPAAIEASWKEGRYTEIHAQPRNGTYSGTLRNQPTGQGKLTVRFIRNNTVSATKDYVGIGDVFLIAGQSNAEGRVDASQHYNHPTIKAGVFRENRIWAELVDPTDSDGFNSVWPLVGTSIAAHQNVPVAFITTADAGTGLASPQPDWSKGGKAYTNAIATIRASGVQGIKAILWHQGESDVHNGVSQHAYETTLSQMLDDMQAETGFSNMKLVAASLGPDTSSEVTREKIDAIRSAIADRWEHDADILSGPVTYDIDLYTKNGPSDGTHYRTDADVRTLGDRWWAALAYHFYGSADGKGPRLRAAQHNSEKTEITLIFSDETLPLTPAAGFGGFSLKENGIPVPIRDIQKIANNKLKIILASAAQGTLTISLGSFNDGSGALVPRDSSAYQLPAEVFIDYPTTPYDARYEESAPISPPHRNPPREITVRNAPLQETPVTLSLEAQGATTAAKTQKKTFFPLAAYGIGGMIVITAVLLIKKGMGI